jgi:hypothetical protein
MQSKQQLDDLLRKMIEDSAIDISKIDNDPPYPLIWDKDFNFIGHKVLEQIKDKNEN